MLLAPTLFKTPNTARGFHSVEVFDDCSGIRFKPQALAQDY